MSMDKASLYLLYSDATSETGKKIGLLLNCDKGYQPPEKQYDIILNYGAATECDPELARLGILNNPLAVHENATSKELSLQKMRHVCVNVPELMTPGEAIARMELPMIARMSKHRAGQGAMICITENDVRDAIQGGFTHFMKMLSIRYEGRIHVFDDSAWMLQQKVGRFVRNRHIRTGPNGWSLDTKNRWYNSFPKETIHQAILACRATGLLFGAVDVGISTTDNKAYVFEINTGAGLTGGNHCDMFIKIMKDYVRRTWKKTI